MLPLVDKKDSVEDLMPVVAPVMLSIYVSMPLMWYPARSSSKVPLLNVPTKQKDTECGGPPQDAEGTLDLPNNEGYWYETIRRPEVDEYPNPLNSPNAPDLHDS